MTIEVEIKHKMPGYDKCITVEEMTVDVTGNVVSRGHPSYKVVVKPGGFISKYVWPGQVLQVTEGPNVADLPADPTTTQP